MLMTFWLAKKNVLGGQHVLSTREINNMIQKRNVLCIKKAKH